MGSAERNQQYRTGASMVDQAPLVLAVLLLATHAHYSHQSIGSLSVVPHSDVSLPPYLSVLTFIYLKVLPHSFCV